MDKRRESVFTVTCKPPGPVTRSISEIVVKGRVSRTAHIFSVGARLNVCDLSQCGNALS
jgi:hypothetical protein